MKKYNNVKARIFEMRDKEKEIAVVLKATGKELELKSHEFETLDTKHNALLLEKSSRDKLMSKRYEKTKQLLEKRDKELRDMKEDKKDLEK